MSFFDEIGSWIQNIIDLIRGKDDDNDREWPDPSRPMLGYGLVDDWHHRDPAEFCRTCSDYGIDILCFEIWDWLDYPGTFHDWRGAIARFEPWIWAAQDNKVLLYVHLTQGNHGRSGGTNNSNFQDAIYGVGRKFAEWTKKHPWIYVTPVAEGGNCHGSVGVDRALQEWCKARIPRKQLVNNWPSKPSGTDGMGFACWHPANLATGLKAPSGQWVMSDHGTFIRWLTKNNDLASGECDYGRVLEAAKRLRQSGRTFIVFDTNTTRHSPSLPALRALRDAR